MLARARTRHSFSLPFPFFAAVSGLLLLLMLFSVIHMTFSLYLLNLHTKRIFLANCFNHLHFSSTVSHTKTFSQALYPAYFAIIHQHSYTKAS